MESGPVCGASTIMKCFHCVIISTADSLTRLDTVQKTRSSNFTGGEKAGGSWTTKVMGVKQTQEVPPSLPQDQVEGADDEEWVGHVT